jgi:hypothetical protein
MVRPQEQPNPGGVDEHAVAQIQDHRAPALLDRPDDRAITNSIRW